MKVFTDQDVAMFEQYEYILNFDAKNLARKDEFSDILINNGVEFQPR